MDRTFLKVGYVGLLVMGMSILLVIIFPSKASKMPDGFITPVIAFEFIETRMEVFQMFMSTDGTIRQEMVDAMDLGNQLDFIYMLLYSMFLLMFSLKCAKISSEKFYYIGAALSLMVLSADALENIQLMGITANLESGEFESCLTWLHLFTWIKWGGIATIFLVLFFWFIKGDIFSKIIGFTGILSFLTGVLAYLNRSVLNEIFGLTVAMMFLMMIVYCFTYKYDSD
ncbi:MAG: hypothetical protein HF978_07815 [Desulfobacteraceae bacterium]|nr:hypothetical protein [Desulfobacteraceae bacterium]MBC2755436.1 hypothetical protein [Desulfobacteraceae bacterium]